MSRDVWRASHMLPSWSSKRYRCLLPHRVFSCPSRWQKRQRALLREQMPFAAQRQGAEKPNSTNRRRPEFVQSFIQSATACFLSALKDERTSVDTGICPGQFCQLGMPCVQLAPILVEVDFAYTCIQVSPAPAPPSPFCMALVSMPLVLREAIHSAEHLA